MIGATLGGQTLGGPTGPGSIVGVNVLQGDTRATGTLATVDLLNGDGAVAQVALPTTPQGVQQGLAPVSALAGTLLGGQAADAVTQLTNGVAPVVATVTSAADQVAAPLLDTLNGALAPIVAPLAGENGVLAPVAGLVQGIGAGPLVGADLGGNAVTGASTADTLAGVNLLSPGAGAAQGRLLTVDVLTQDAIVDVTLPTTATGVEAGLQPVGNLVGTLLGPQAGSAVDQVATGAAPVVATVTSTVDSIVAPVVEAAGGLAPIGGGSPLSPVTDLVGGVLAPGSGGAGSTTPLTGLLGGLLGK